MCEYNNSKSKIIATLLIVCSLMLVSLLFGSCERQYDEYIPVDTIEDNFSRDSNVVEGTTWVLYRYRDGSFGSTQSISDTIVFETPRILTYNGYETYYSCYRSSDMWSLTMYDIRFGSIAALIPNFSLETGDISAREFRQVSNSNDGRKYIIWMRKL